MKRIIYFGFLLIFTTFSSCEKDDICVDGDTPLLIIRFYDAENPTEFKSVTRLRVVGQGKTTTVDTFADRSMLDSIAIPLNPASDTTGFFMINDSKDDDEGNEAGDIDNLTFSYQTIDTYVSRACGFVANYENLDSDLTMDAQNWIQNIEIVKPLVKLEPEETSAHVKIFH
jgi:hypothetical protein